MRSPLRSQAGARLVSQSPGALAYFRAAAGDGRRLRLIQSQVCRLSNTALEKIDGAIRSLPPLTRYAAGGGGGGFGGLGGGGFGGLGCTMGATLSRLWPPRRRRETRFGAWVAPASAGPEGCSLGRGRAMLCQRPLHVNYPPLQPEADITELMQVV